jgi:hypothetical protein
MFSAIVQPETHLDHLLLTRSQRLQH